MPYRVGLFFGVRISGIILFRDVATFNCPGHTITYSVSAEEYRQQRETLIEGRASVLR